MTVTCKLGENGCWNDGKCRATSNCENKVVTNADRIRAMTDEELATTFVQHEYTVANAILGGFGVFFHGDDAYFEATEKELLKRLQQPVEE